MASSSSSDHNPGYESFENRLKSLADSLRDIKSTAHQKIQESESEANKAVEKLQKFRKEINDFLGEVEGEIRSSETEDKEKIKGLLGRCDTLSREIEDTRQDLAAKRNNNQTHQQTLDKYENEVSELSVRINRVRKMEFDPSPELAALISSRCEISILAFEHRCRTVALSKSTSTIRSIECIADGICVVREDDGTLKMIDTNPQTAIEICSKKPENVTRSNKLAHPFADGGSYITNVPENEIAVIVQSGIYIYSTANNQMTTPRSKIKISSLLALAYANEKFIVVVGSGLSAPTLHIVDMINGEEESTFSDAVKRDCLFNIKEPRYLAVNPEQTLIYVSDQGTNTVTCLSITGEIRVKKKVKGWSPRCVAVSRDGTVYVCSEINIYVFTSDLQQRTGVIKGKRHGFMSPSDIAYCRNQHKLYVASGSPRDNIVVIDL